MVIIISQSSSPSSSSLISSHTFTNLPSSPLSHNTRKQHSSGRGGAGNISNSRSRSRGPGNFFGSVVAPPDSPRHSTGRGGVGNIQPGAEGVEAIDEVEAYRVTHDPDGM